MVQSSSSSSLSSSNCWHVDNEEDENPKNENPTTTCTSSMIGMIQQHVIDELELLKHIPIDDDDITNDGERFPKGCKSFLLKQIPGNEYCIDCGKSNPDWASITYGVLLCMRCSGIHRSYGVEVSRVRSIHMDHWSYKQILMMLEGGNSQLQQFFKLHNLSTSTSSSSASKTTKTTTNHYDGSSNRYQTKVAKCYRTNLGTHVTEISNSDDCYKGRTTKRKHHLMHHAAANIDDETIIIAETRNNNIDDDEGETTNTTSCASSSSSSNIIPATTTPAATTTTHSSNSKRRSSIQKQEHQKQRCKQKQQQQSQSQCSSSKTLPARQSSNNCYNSFFGLFV